MDKLRIGYFLEDIGHRKFLVSLTKRIAQEILQQNLGLEQVVRNASGGKGRVMKEFGDFLRSAARSLQSGPPILVVAIDGNCQGYTEKRREIEVVRDRYSYQGYLVCAIPDPHIERWYIADREAFQRVAQGSSPVMPPYKCERGHYKKVIADAIGLSLPLGGAELGEDIVAELDLYKAQQADRCLKHFIDQFRAAIRSHQQ